jgi:alpha-mannosidase
MFWTHVRHDDTRDNWLLRCLFVVPHTHWDREWYRPFEHFRLELGRVVDGVLDVLERDPSFNSFTLDGQAILLEDYLAVRPENEGRLRALLAADRLEVGPSYVLPDEFLVGGEPLVRNLLIGRAVCERFGASPSPVGYLPDSFGHPLQLPQILSGFGLDSFIFMRGLGDQLDDLGVVFRWRAPDGSEVLALQLLPSYGNFAELDGPDDAERRVREITARFGPALERAGVEELLLCNGNDHVAVQPELPEWCRELEARFPGTRVTIARYADYVQAVKGADVPALAGELLGSRVQNVLRGVNSARMYIKQANELAERRLLGVETLAALGALHAGAPFPTADFRLAWSELLRCHPHDSICGCSCDEAHRDMLVRYESLHRTLSLLQARALERFAGVDRPGPDLLGAGARRRVGVVNLLPERRAGVVELPGHEPFVIEVDGFSARTVDATPLGADAPGIGAPADSSAATAIESDRIRVEVAPDGLTVLDKRSGRRLERVHVLEDESDMGDLYTFCPVEGTGTWRGQLTSARVIADGPVVWELEIRVEGQRPAGLDAEHRPLPETAPLSISTIVRLVRGSRRVQLRTTIENATRDHRVRAVFPTAVDEAEPSADPRLVRAEGQFAVAPRPLVPEPPRAHWAEPPDLTQHTLGAVALGPIALLTKGLPEYEARPGADGAELYLTLLRSVGIISRPSGVLATRPHGAGPQLGTPEGQCIGRHELEYALLLDADELDDTALLREAQDFRWGFLVLDGELEFQAPVELAGDVVFSCLKGAEDGDGLILRCFNVGATDARTRVSGRLSVSRTRLDETGEQPLVDGALVLGPGEIGTLRLRARG